MPDLRDPAHAADIRTTTDHDFAACIASIPLYADLDDDERAELVVGLRRLEFRPGDVLMQQGSQPDGAYFILSGTVRVTTALPGGGEALIAEPGPGSTLGELALIRSVPRTATVTAIGPVAAIFADRRFFGAALAQLRPGAFKVLRQLALLLAGRLRVLHDRIREAATCDDCPYQSLPLLAAPDGPPDGGAPAGFDTDAFLPLLPCFRDFDASAIAALRGRATIVSPRRGYRLCNVGEDAGSAYIVVRGAVASGFVHDGGMHLLNVLGPGRFCAVGPLIEDRPVSACCVVRENAVLLRIDREPFRDLYHGVDRSALAFVTAINEHQATMVSRAANHLTRLVGLSRLNRQFHRGAEVTV